MGKQCTRQPGQRYTSSESSLAVLFLLSQFPLKAVNKGNKKLDILETF